VVYPDKPKLNFYGYLNGVAIKYTSDKVNLNYLEPRTKTVVFYR